MDRRRFIAEGGSLLTGQVPLASIHRVGADGAGATAAAPLDFRLSRNFRLRSLACAEYVSSVLDTTNLSLGEQVDKRDGRREN